MKQADREEVLDVVDNEGFDYAFVNHSSFTEIKDEKFHELREEYIEAHKKLAAYIGLEE